jgi:hypothetical protein
VRSGPCHGPVYSSDCSYWSSAFISSSSARSTGSQTRSARASPPEKPDNVRIVDASRAITIRTVWARGEGRGTAVGGVCVYSPW